MQINSQMEGTIQMSQARASDVNGEEEFMVMNKIRGVVDSMIIKCAVKLQVFDAIHRHGRPISLDDLASALPVQCSHPASLRRIMRNLGHMRLVDIRHEAVGEDGEEEESYALTAASSAFLREESEHSLAHYVRFMLEEDMLGVLHGLDTCVTGGGNADTPAIERLGRPSFYEWAARETAIRKRFDDAMICTARSIVGAVAKGCSKVFKGVNTLVDVGGGCGSMAAAIARAHPGIRCIVYDLPHVVQDAPAHKHVEYQSGDMFVSVPRADAVLLVRILHNWDEEKASKILERCREAIAEDKGKLIIVDSIIDKKHNSNQQLLGTVLHIDMVMMAYFGGKERTEKEWRILLSKAGFDQLNITELMSTVHVIEARVSPQM